MGAVAMSKDQRKTNHSLVSLIGDLKDHSRSTGSALWRDIAGRLEASRKNWAEPNLSHISRHSEKKETILVPGKVLGSGTISGGQTVAAFSFSEGAKTKIESSGGRTLSIRELMEENPNGKGVRILV
jgi:large subunit ribosomal protein L18e